MSMTWIKPRGIPTTYSEIVLADAPVVYYRLNETGGAIFKNLGSAGASADATPNANQVSAPSLIVRGADSLATTFDYNSSYYKATTTYTISQEPLSVEFWVEPSTLAAFGSTSNFVVSCGTTGGWTAQYVHNTGVWRFTTHGIKDYDSTASAAAVGKRQYVVMVLDTDHSVSFYINGSFVDKITHNTGPSATSNTLSLGVRSADVAAGMAGIVDEVAIYTTALTAAQIKKHWIAAGDFAPTDISTLKGWWDFSDASILYTDDGTTPVSADGDLLYHVKDKSITGATMLQATSDNRPVYKRNVYRGKSVARFSTSDGMTTTSSALLSAFTGADLPFTLFMVCKDSTSAAYTEMFRIGTHANGYPKYQFLYRLSPASYYLSKYDDTATGKDVISDNDSSPTGVWRSVIWKDTGTVGTIYHNSTLVTTGSTDSDVGTMTPTGVVRIGAAAGAGLDLIGDVGEVLLYTSALSDSDRATVQAYLANKWGL